MSRLLSVWFVASVWAGLSATEAHALEIEGYNFPADAQAAGQAVKLVGAGVRTKWMMNVYVLGAYQATVTRKASFLVGSDEPKMLWLHMLRGIDASKMRDAIDEGLEKNVGSAERARIQGDVDKIKAAFPATVGKGLDIQFIHSPSAGFVLKIGGAQKVASADKALSKAMWSIWFGSHPADSDLKKGVLGE